MYPAFAMLLSIVASHTSGQ